jgi:hypothetical protein
MTGQADLWIRRTTTSSVTILALIAGTVSYLHLHALVVRHGQPGWVAALTPLSVDGMIVAASTTLLSESRSGNRGGVLPWALLVIGSLASLAANVAVAEPTVVGRVIAAWPSFALIGSYELLMRQVRHAASGLGRSEAMPSAASSRHETPAMPATSVAPAPPSAGRRGPEAKYAVLRGTDATPRTSQGARRQAWEWAVANKDVDGSLPSGRVIADRYGRHERWGRLVKAAGNAGAFADTGSS